MKYLLIAVLPFLLFSSFENDKISTVVKLQLDNSDSCKVLKTFSNGKLSTVYQYDSMKNIIRIDYYRKVYQAKEMVLIDYSEFFKQKKMVNGFGQIPPKNTITNITNRILSKVKNL